MKARRVSTWQRSPLSSELRSNPVQRTVYLIFCRNPPNIVPPEIAVTRTCEMLSIRASYPHSWPSRVFLMRLPKDLTPGQSAACKKVGLDADEIGKLVDKPLYQFSESEVDHLFEILEQETNLIPKQNHTLSPQEYWSTLRALLARRNALRTLRPATTLLPG